MKNSSKNSISIDKRIEKWTMKQHSHLLDPITLAHQHLAEIRALLVKNAKNLWTVRRRFAKSLKEATPEHVLEVARDLFYNTKNPGHALSLLALHKKTFQTLGENEIE